MQWLPLFRRLLARLSQFSGVDLIPSTTDLGLALSDANQAKLALIRITAVGLDCQMAFSGALPHKSTPLLLSDTSDLLALDEELMTWIIAARAQARTSTEK